VNHEAVIRAAFFMAKALGKRTSRREVNELIVKHLGKGFRPQEIAAVLATLREPLRNQHGTTKEPAPESKTSIQGTSTGTNGKPSTLIPVPVNLASCSVPEPSAQKPKSPRATKLPFDVTFLEQRRVLLNAVWALAQPAIGRSITAEEWRKRNSRAAGDMVKAGVAAALVVAAWHHASERIGEPVRTMALVQDELGRTDCAAMASQQQANKRATEAAERVYFKAPPPTPWELPLGNKA
jgi:hypothetical protein